MKFVHKDPEKVWSEFQALEQLTDFQLEQFKRYEAFLSQSNKEFNLTAITELTGIVRQHFSDSLALRKFVDLSTIKTIADVGTGAGFPAIPLKIIFPHLSVILIEVTTKKRDFLADLIDILELKDVQLCAYDWRTFLRTTEYDVDFFVTRAALGEQELCRAFKPGCRYKCATIVYWISAEWECEPKESVFIKKIESYKLGPKQRKLAFLGLKV